MPTNYPSGVDSFTTHHDGLGEAILAADINKVQDAVAAIEAELGLTPKGSSADVAARLAGLLRVASNLSDVANAGTARTNLGLGTAATISSTAGGDLSGTLPSPTVAKVNGVTVSGTPSSSGQVLAATGTTAAAWSNAAVVVDGGDATSTFAPVPVGPSYVSIAQIAADPALTGTFAALTALPKYPDGTTTATTVARTKVLDPRDYGVVMNSSGAAAANTTAMQNFVNAVVTGGLIGEIPAGTIYINAKLNFSARPGWTIRGAGPAATIIQQQTDNTPIFDLGTDNVSFSHSMEVSGLALTYANSQAATNTSANPIKLSNSVFEARFTSLRFLRGSWAFGLASGVVPPWGTTFDDLQFGSGLTGGAMDWSLGINAVPNNRFGRFFCDCANMVGPVFSIRGYAFVIDTIEFLNAAQGARLMDVAAGAMVSIGAMKLEVGAYPSGTKSLFRFSAGCVVDIGHLYVGGTTLTTDGILYILETGSGGANGGSLRVENLRAAVTGGSGTAYVAAAGEPVIIGNLDITGLNVTNVGSSDSANRVTIQGHVNGRLSDNKGDADYTIALGDPTVVRFETAFTAQRTINLPSTNTSLSNGLTYEINFSGAINGANTALIKCGGTTLATATEDGTTYRFTYRRNAVSAANGWVLTWFGQRPLIHYPATNRRWLENGSPSGTFRESFDRRLALSNLTLTSGVMLSTSIPLYVGDLVTNLSFRSGNVPASGPTAWWFALYGAQATPVLVSQTANQATAAWAASTTVTLPLSTPYLVPADGLYYASVMMAAGTPVNLFGQSSNGTASLGPMPGQKTLAQTQGSSLTTTAPGTIAGGSATSPALCYAT